MNNIENTEIQIQCPHCKLYNCYESILNKTKTYICFSCGYSSNETFTIESEKNKDIQEKKHDSKTARMIVDLAFEDIERELVWYPAVLQIATVGIVFPEPEGDTWVWNFSPIEMIRDDEKGNFKIPGTEEFYTSRIAIEKAERFNKNDFSVAVGKLGIKQPDIKEDKNDNDM